MEYFGLQVWNTLISGIDLLSNLNSKVDALIYRYTHLLQHGSRHRSHSCSTHVLPLDNCSYGAQLIDAPYYQVLARHTAAPLLAILPSILGLIRGCLQSSAIHPLIQLTIIHHKTTSYYKTTSCSKTTSNTFKSTSLHHVC